MEGVIQSALGVWGAVLTVGRPHIRALLSEMHDVVGDAMILTKSRSPSQAGAR